jgi:hypothetical protein
VDDLGPVPVACHLFDGNRNGHTGIKQQYDLMRNWLDLPKDFLLVSDRGTCSAEHLGRLLSHQHYALCAGQWQDYGPLFDRRLDRLAWKQAGYQSREQQRRRACNSSLPLEEYRLAVVDHQLVDPDGKPFPVRVIFVHSSASEKESRQRREENIVKIRKGLAEIARKLERGHPSTTNESVKSQIVRLVGKKSAAQFFRWELVPLTEAERAALPPPAKGCRKQTHRLEYSFDEAAAQADVRHDGVSALVTTAPLRMSADALFAEYKRQTYVERGHHELKLPVAVTPVFLKTPRRVESLVSLLFVALQASMTLERLYRKRVARGASASEQRMTTERILRLFRVCGLLVDELPGGMVVRVPQLSRGQRRILQHLGLPTPIKLLASIQRPPPN